MGAVYAVPHAPRCGSYSCRGVSAEYGSPCWEVSPGQIACGVVGAKPEPPKPEPPEPEPPRPEPPAQPPAYSFPGGLPKPLDRAARVVGRFKITFAG